MENNIFVNAEASQISLMDIFNATGGVMKKREYSDKLPECVSSFYGSKTFRGLELFLESVSGLKNAVIYKANRYTYRSPETEYFVRTADGIDGTTVVGVNETYSIKNANNVISVISKYHSVWKTILMYVTEAGTVYEAEASIAHVYAGGFQESYKITGVEISKWKKAKLHSNRMITVINYDEVDAILNRVNPYAAELMKKYSELEAVDLLIAPQIEQLYKAGYSFVDKELLPALWSYEESSTLDQFNRLCQPGKNMKEIFKTSKAVYTALKSCNKLSVWDIYRKMDKQGKISAENVERAYDNGYSEKELNEISVILSREYAGKKIFTWDTLQRYLERIDMYEAIDRMDGLQLLKDYLNMCKQLEMKPRIDGDSLKREHDVTARTLRQKKDEIRANKMIGVCEDNKKYDYSEHIYFGRCIRSYDDLIDEATQQHNCVAGYADSIIAKKSYIFVVREVSSPDRSLATVELTKDGDIRQKYLAYNRPIRNKALTEFIDRLSKNFKTVNASSRAVA